MSAPLAADVIRAERMDAASQTAGALAHEIANYLGMVRSLLFLLREEVTADAQAAADLDTLSRTVEGACGLVEALRSFAHAPALGAGPSDLNAVLRSSEAALRAQLPADRRLTLVLAPGSLSVAADGSAIARLATLLVGVAGSDLPAGGRVEVATERSPGPGGAPAAVLLVRDDGPGLETARAARIFEPFVRDAGRDAGLGLPMVYNTVMRSGGAITAESAPGMGTRIRIALPLAGQARGAEAR